MSDESTANIEEEHRFRELQNVMLKRNLDLRQQVKKLKEIT
jgi:hypothetical protein